MNNTKNLDPILDEALSEYREAEPLAGLEDRVLQRLRLQPEKRRTAWWKWGALATCAALLLVALWIGIGGNWMRNSPRNQIAGKQQAAQVPSTTPASDETNANRQGPHQEIVSRESGTLDKGPQAVHRDPQERLAGYGRTRSSVPKAAQFPLSAPLTSEEHALLALASLNRDVLLNQPDRSGDVEISPIEIKPLAGSDAPAQENSNE
jgi:hypothetical protein